MFPQINPFHVNTMAKCWLTLWWCPIAISLSVWTSIGSLKWSGAELICHSICCLRFEPLWRGRSDRTRLRRVCSNVGIDGIRRRTLWRHRDCDLVILIDIAMCFCVCGAFVMFWMWMWRKRIVCRVCVSRQNEMYTVPEERNLTVDEWFVVKREGIVTPKFKNKLQVKS